MKVLVLNQYAGNKGDRAVCWFVLRELMRNGVSDIIVSTHDRSFWREEGNQGTMSARLVPWGWDAEGWTNARGWRARWWWERQRFTRKVLFPLVRDRVRLGKGLPSLCSLGSPEFVAAVREADLLISTGGHHLTTRFGAECVVAQVYDLMIAHLAKKPLVLWSQTIGPFHFSNKKNEEAVRAVLNGAAQVWIRDITSVDVCRDLGVTNPNLRQTYESVVGLNDLVQDYVAPSDRDPVCGIAVYNAETRDNGDDHRYINAIAEIADRFVDQGLQVKFFPHEMKGAVINDRAFIQRIIKRMRRPHGVQMLDPDLDTPSHLRHVSQCRVFLGHKTHSIVFSLTVGTPLIALSYHPKTRDFMNQYELPQQCIDDKDLTPERVLETYARMRGQLDEIGRHQFETSRRFGESVRRDFRDMLAHQTMCASGCPGSRAR
jgi:polysaccharide pyruvyl transferase WcaK-like protein